VLCEVDDFAATTTTTAHARAVDVCARAATTDDQDLDVARAGRDLECAVCGEGVDATPIDVRNRATGCGDAGAAIGHDERIRGERRAAAARDVRDDVRRVARRAVPRDARRETARRRDGRDRPISRRPRVDDAAGDDVSVLIEDRCCDVHRLAVA
jgi:hypothetical protein